MMSIIDTESGQQETMREDFLHHNGKKLWYSVYGEDRPGMPVLVIHGGPGFLSMPQVVRDFSSKRPVYLYDQLGCGRSDKAADRTSYAAEYYVNELAEVLRQLRLDSVCLMGFSWGTALACAYMLKYKPACIKGLVLCGPLLSTARWDADQRDNIAGMPESVRKAIISGEKAGDYSEHYQSAMMEYYYRHVYRLNPWPAYLRKALSLLNPDVYNFMWGPSEFTITGTLKNLDLLPDLHKIQVPVLLVCGDHDEAGTKTVKDYQAAFANACMAVIPNASHLHHLEQPHIFKAVVNRFFEQVSPG